MPIAMEEKTSILSVTLGYRSSFETSRGERVTLSSIPRSGGREAPIKQKKAMFMFIKLFMPVHSDRHPNTAVP